MSRFSSFTHARREGVACAHRLAIVGTESISTVCRTIPSVVKKTRTETGAASAAGAAEAEPAGEGQEGGEGLRIAWRYKNMVEGAEAARATFCHSLDLMRSVDESVLAAMGSLIADIRAPCRDPYSEAFVRLLPALTAVDSCVVGADCPVADEVQSSDACERGSVGAIACCCVVHRVRSVG